MTSANKEFPRGFERKILCKIFGARFINGRWRIRTNYELRNLYGKPDIVGEIKANRIRWIGQMEMAKWSRVEMYENRAVKRFSGES